MSEPVLTPEQVAEQGEKIYQERLKDKLEPKEIGRFVAIEVTSGDYFLGNSILETLQEAQKKFPNKVFHTIRIGFGGVFKVGRLRGGRQ